MPGLVDSIRASGGALVDPDPASLGRALVDFFSGQLELQPVNSLVPWADVTDIVERRLIQALDSRGEYRG